jgi:hypothetical protein
MKHVTKLSAFCTTNLITFELNFIFTYWILFFNTTTENKLWMI